MMMMMMMMIMMMMMMMMMIIIIIIIISFKGAIQDFLQFSSLRRETVSNCTLKCPGRSRVRIICITSSVYHVQLCRVMCHVVRRDSY